MPAATARVVSVTTFNGDFSLDEDGYRRHLRRLASAGLTVFIAGEGCSEVLSLHSDEVRRVLAVGADELVGVVPVVALGFCPRTADAQIEFVAMAEATGHTTIGIYPLDVVHHRIPTEAELETYYDAVLASTTLDVVIPCFTPHDAPQMLSPALLGRLVERHKHIVEVQCTGHDLAHLVHVMQAVGPRVGVHSGGIEHALTNVALGGTGFVCAEANVAPHLCQALVDACNEHRVEDAGSRLRSLIELKAIHRGYGFITALKAMMDAWDLDGGPVRPPLLPLTPEAIRALNAELEATGAREQEMAQLA